MNRPAPRSRPRPLTRSRPSRSHHPRIGARGPGRSTLHLGALLAALLLIAPAAGAATPEAEVEPRAGEVAQRVMEALGGADAWAATRLIHFDFAGRRTHHWDKGTGRHRLEGDTREGQHYVVIQDLDEGRGRAWLDGREAQGEDLQELLEMAHGAWVNDTYWLLMPYKLTDPGVHLTFEGTEAEGGTTYDVLGLEFRGVGLTPGDRYWAWIDRDTGLMDRWGYRLQSQPEDADPTLWRWEGWDWYGPEDAAIRLAPRREMVEGGRTLELGPIEVTAEVPDELFAGP